MTDTSSTITLYKNNFDLDQIILAIANQDQEALQTLYYQYRRAIFAVAYAMTHDHQLAEDVLQETIVHIWENASNYHPGGSSKAWILAIAHNQSLDFLRKQNPCISLENFESHTLPEQLIACVNPDDRIMLVSGLNCLNPDQAVIFTLKAIAGLSHLETAKLLNMRYRSVRFKYHQAISKLRKYLSCDDIAYK